MINQLDTIVTNCLEVNDLDLYFGTKYILKKINLSIPKRNVTAIIGPSGCGKSTLIRTLNRMHDLDEDVRITGKVSLLGQDIYHRSVNAHDLRKKIGMVFQKPNPFPISIYDNVAYGLQIKGIPNRYHKERVEKALVQSSLFDEVKDKLNADALSLSGGQQQRLCIARAIAIEPEVILMDEPCSALDPISTQRIEELIFTLREQYTIVIVTHNMEQAIRVADFTGFMFLGELIEWDRTEAIFNYPKQELTSNYVRGHFS